MNSSHRHFHDVSNCHTSIPAKMVITMHTIYCALNIPYIYYRNTTNREMHPKHLHFTSSVLSYHQRPHTTVKIKTQCSQPQYSRETVWTQNTPYAMGALLLLMASRRASNRTEKQHALEAGVSGYRYL